MADEIIDYGAYGSLGFETGVPSLLAILRNNPRDGFPLGTINTNSISLHDVLFASSFTYDLEEKADDSERYAGEGTDANTFLLKPATIKATIKLPITVAGIGCIDPAFDLIWHLTRQAAQGSPTSALATLSPQGGTSNYFLVDNAQDFASIVGVAWGGPLISNPPTPTACYVFGPDGTAYGTATIISVNKHGGQLNLQSSFTHSYPTGAIVVAAPDVADSGFSYPTFTLLSQREGLIGPCVVNKLTVSCTPGKSVEAEIEIVSLKIDRSQQPALVGIRNQIASLAGGAAPTRQIEAVTCSLSLITPTGGAYGMTGPQGDPLFGGFQGLGLPSVSVSSFSFTIDNHLKESHALNQVASPNKANAFPFALYSEGRQITGKISYKASVAPVLLAERLSAHSFVDGGGLSAQFGPAQVQFPPVLWSPSKSEGEAASPTTRSLDWSVFSDSSSALSALAFQAEV
jgi:hypothetical protein